MTEEQHKFIDLAVVRQVPYETISKETGIDKKVLSLWWEELKEERERISKVCQLWRKKCLTSGFWDFYKWYTSAVRECYYCKITEEKIAMLISNGKIITKRLSTRGRNLEIERIEPNLSYDALSNLVYCCNWCNNAKTDEFTESAFKLIGQGISEIWKSRLENLNEKI